MARENRNVQRDIGINRDIEIDRDLGIDIGISDEQDGTLRGQDSLHEVERDAREKVYPAPLARVEPLKGHAIDPDGEEQAVEDAELKARDDRQADEPTMELSMTAAALGGIDGLGVLREVRDSDGDTASMPGSWRPGATDGRLPESIEVGKSLRFEGPLHRANGSVEHVVSDVNVTSVGDYTTTGGERLVLVNFKVSEPGMLVHAAPDDGTLPSS